MSISATAVKALRDRTNAPMMDCKSALAEAQGDMEKAIEILRSRNAALRDKKGERETAEGRVAVFIDPVQKVGAIVEVRCESAPVAKTEAFVQLATDLARQAALQGIESAEQLTAQPQVSERINEVIGLLRENMKVARVARLTGLLGSYSHHDGTVAVLLQVEGDQADPQLLRDVCMHITAKTPVAARREDVPKSLIDREMEIARQQAASTGKPAPIVEKIAEGKVKAWFAESVLVEQPFVKDESRTVGDLLKGAGLKVVKFIRYKVGELS